VLHLSAHASDGIAVILPSATSGGVQVDITGAGVSRHAANPEDAVRFLEWLASDDGQRAVARSGTGIPVSAAVEMGAPPGEYRQISPADIDVSQLAALSGDAAALVERAHYP
jgi:iron(III) transport system substrate-binding protein